MSQPVYPRFLKLFNQKNPNLIILLKYTFAVYMIKFIIYLKIIFNNTWFSIKLRTSRLSHILRWIKMSLGIGILLVLHKLVIENPRSLLKRLVIVLLKSKNFFFSWFYNLICRSLQRFQTLIKDRSNLLQIIPVWNLGQ